MSTRKFWFGPLCALILVLYGVDARAAGADTRLLDATKKGDTAAVRALLKERADANTRAGDGATALHWAAYRGERTMAELLLQAGASLNATNDLGVTALWVASASRNVTIVEVLLEAGADPNITPRTGATPLMVAARTGSADAVKLLAMRGARVNEAEAGRRQTALMWAVSRQHPQVVRVLVEAGADVNARTATSRHHVLLCCAAFSADRAGEAEVDYGGSTPLLFAARVGDLESARILIAAGAHVNDTLEDGTSALAQAAMSGHTDVAELLIESGADVNAARAGFTPLHAAVVRSDVRLARTLLSHGAHPNPRLTNATPSRRRVPDYAFDKFLVGATPFMVAVRRAEIEIMQALAAGGADLMVPLENGTPAIVLAAQGETKTEGRAGGTEDMALGAVRTAVALGVPLNAPNADGDTAVHVAADQRYHKVIEFLAQRGAALDEKNVHGDTPIAVALRPPQPWKGSGILPPPKPDGRKTEDLLRQLGARE